MASLIPSFGSGLLPQGGAPQASILLSSGQRPSPADRQVRQASQGVLAPEEPPAKVQKLNPVRVRLQPSEIQAAEERKQVPRKPTYQEKLSSLDIRIQELRDAIAKTKGRIEKLEKALSDSKYLLNRLGIKEKKRNQSKDQNQHKDKVIRLLRIIEVDCLHLSYLIPELSDERDLLIFRKKCKDPTLTEEFSKPVNAKIMARRQKIEDQKLKQDAVQAISQARWILKQMSENGDEEDEADAIGQGVPSNWSKLEAQIEKLTAISCEPDDPTEFLHQKQRATINSHKAASAQQRLPSPPFFLPEV